MSREAAHRIPPQTRPTPRAAWYALIAPPLAWALQEWLGWYFGQRTCSSLTPPSVRWILLGVSAAALAASLYGVAGVWTMSRDIVDPDHRERVDFLSFGGLLVSGIFSIAIVWGGLSTAFLAGCGVIR
jgi:hypothetical protein